MEIRQLRYFVEIADSRSLSRAAERLAVAQPALSQHMFSLEAELKTKLLVRSSRGVTLTEAGKILQQRARALLQELDNTRKEILRPKAGASGQVSVGLPPTITTILGSQLFTKMRERHPGVYLHLIQDTGARVADRLAEGQLDMCITYRRPPNTDGAYLLDESFYLIGEPESGVSAHDVCTIQELSGVPLVLQSPGYATRTLIERMFAQEHANLNVIADIDSTALLIRLAAVGAGCTLVPWSALPQGFAKNSPVRLIVEPSIQRPVSLVFSSVLPRTQASTAVAEILRETIEGLVQDGQWAGARLKAKKER